MKKKIAIILAIILILSLCIVLCSCGNSTKYDDEYISNGDRLILLESGIYGPNGGYNIFYDKETRVMYLYIMSNTNHSGLTVMLDENGKPLLYQGETE